MLQLIINLIAGAAGGNITGALLKKFNMGTVLNTLTGLIGGWLGGTAFGTGEDNMIGGIVGSGAAGGVLTLIVGFVKNLLFKKA
jgi:hypothetical protein